ncbi:MAG: hypothetical protein F6K63_18150 [Moorea sp. SIO1G6]|uniref:hypothetical protein n=1 Tax=Moorena sp. SIO1G6 TaxID=2607840 RepID=UPI0013C11AA5|nr:hypothetical protein [Moorena sp. SIO1G6]NET66201.1 hypothetical protein [Moorena sp. SIO1G6]
MGLTQSTWAKSDVPLEHRFFYSYAIANFKPDRSLCGWYGATRKARRIPPSLKKGGGQEAKVRFPY